MKVSRAEAAVVKVERTLVGCGRSVGVLGGDGQAVELWIVWFVWELDASLDCAPVPMRSWAEVSRPGGAGSPDPGWVYSVYQR